VKEQILISVTQSPASQFVTPDRSVKIPAWFDDQKPLNYFLKYEKAM